MPQRLAQYPQEHVNIHAVRSLPLCVQIDQRNARSAAPLLEKHELSITGRCFHTSIALGGERFAERTIARSLVVGRVRGTRNRHVSVSSFQLENSSE